MWLCRLIVEMFGWDGVLWLIRWICFFYDVFIDMGWFCCVDVGGVFFCF